MENTRLPIEGTEPSRLVSDRNINLGQAGWVLILFKLVYLACVAAALQIWPLHNDNVLRDPVLRFIPDARFTFASHFYAWDADYYLQIANNGYTQGDSRCCFYPLFPFAIRIVSVFTDGNRLIAGMITANICSLAGELLFFAIVGKRFGKRIAWLSLILLLAFPGSLFFQFIYTEGLFFFLLMLLVHSLEEDCVWLACVASFLLPLTRAVGIFCVVPIFWHLFLKTPPDQLPSATNKTSLVYKLISLIAPLQVPNTLAKTTKSYFYIKRYIPLLAPFLGWGVYFLQMWVWTGNPFEGFTAQKQFHCESIGNIFSPMSFIETLIRPTTLHEFYGSLLDRCCFVLLAYNLLIIWRLDRMWFLWALFLGVVPAMSGMFVSYTRFTSMVFPLFVAIATLLNKPSLLSRCLIGLIISSLALLQIVLVWRFINFSWAG
jgi:hypothetical protein